MDINAAAAPAAGDETNDNAAANNYNEANKIKYTQTMENTLLAIVVEMSAHRYGSKSWPEVIKKLMIDGEFKNALDIKKGVDHSIVIRSLKRKVTDICTRCERMMRKGNLSAMPGGVKTPLFEYAETINKDRESDNAEAEEKGEKREAGQKYKRFLDATAKTILEDCVSSSKKKSKHSSKQISVSASSATAIISSSLTTKSDVKPKSTKGGNHPLRQRQLDGTIKDFSTNDKKSSRISLEDKLLYSLLGTSSTDNNDEEMMVELKLNQWVKENDKKIDDFIKEAKISLEHEDFFRDIEFPLLFSTFCAKGASFKTEPFIAAMKDMGCATLSAHRALLVLKRWKDSSSATRIAPPSSAISDNTPSESHFSNDPTSSGGAFSSAAPRELITFLSENEDEEEDSPNSAVDKDDNREN